MKSVGSVPWVRSAAVITLGLVLATVTSTFAMASALGISSGLATNIYFALQWVSWGAAAAAIVGSAGIGAALGVAILAYAKKWALKTFVMW
ncbi:MAG: hypothetical protein ACOYEV_15410 [Candidatus Nanopelagicales bacterium]